MGASSTFAHAPISKAIILGSAFLSLLLSGHKHLLDLPLHPHLTRDFQFWRILTHHAACSTSADLLLTVLILWHTSVAVERRFGTVKYASYLIVVVVIGSLFELIGLVVSHSVFGYRAIPSGPFMVTFAIVYQHGRIVPALYRYRVGEVGLSSQSLVPSSLSLLLLLFNPLSSLAGLLVAALYRNPHLALARWRIRHALLPRFLRSPLPLSRRKPRPTHAALEDDPRFDATITASADP